jgi:putative transposase
MSNSYKKRTRLKDFNYRGSYRYFLTLCSFNKEPVFKDDRLVNWLIRLLRKTSQACGFRIWAYCYMPDHLHLLIEGENSSSDMKRFVSSFKQLTSYYYKKESGRPLWQINFYEYVLRKEEDTKGVANYIFWKSC